MKKCLFALISLFTFVGSSFGAVADINIEFDMKNKLLKGTITAVSQESTNIIIAKSKDFQVLTDEKNIQSDKDKYIIPLKQNQPVIIAYIKNITNSMDTLSDDFISIYSSIIPEIYNINKTQIDIKLNKEFKAVVNEFYNMVYSEDDNSSITSFAFDTLPKRLILHASKNYVIKNIKYKHTNIYSFVFKDKEELSYKLLERSAYFIELYENLFNTKYPYQNFIVAEDISPYGHAVPTMAVFGSTIIGMPFVAERSLGHEILHQWFGCAIDNIEQEGSWVEAMTTYFADYYYEKDNRISYRKDTLSAYEAYTQSEKYPLNKFVANYSKLDQSIGYGKGVMVLHMIKNITGEDNFMAGMRRFVAENLYKNVSWKDIISYFNLPDDFYEIWFEKDKDIALSIKNVRYNDDKVEFTLNRTGGEEKLLIPYTIFGKDKKIKTVETVAGDNELSIPFSSNDKYLFIDTQYDLMRKLNNSEKAPALNYIFGSSRLMFIGDKTDIGLFKKSFNNIDEAVLTHKLKNHYIKDKNVVISIRNTVPSQIINLIQNNEILQFDIDKATYRVIKNPYSKGDNFILLAFNAGKSTLDKLRHYGSYSEIIIKDNNVIDKKKVDTNNGILVYSNNEEVE